MRHIVIVLCSALVLASCTTAAPSWTVISASKADGTLTIQCEQGWASCERPTQDQFRVLVQKPCQSWGYASASALGVRHDGFDPNKVSVENSMRAYAGLFRGVKYRILYQCTEDDPFAGGGEDAK